MARGGASTGEEEGEDGDDEEDLATAGCALESVPDPSASVEKVRLGAEDFRTGVDRFSLNFRRFLSYRFKKKAGSIHGILTAEEVMGWTVLDGSTYGCISTPSHGVASSRLLL